MKKFDIRKTGENATTGGLILAGMVVGNMACNQIDKMINKDGDSTDSSTAGLLGLSGISIKKSVAPLITIAGGLAITQFVDNKHAKPIGHGMIAMGGVKLVKGLMDKDLLAGDPNESTAGIYGFGNLALAGGELDNALKMIDQNLVSGFDDDQIGSSEMPVDYAGVGGDLNIDYSGVGELTEVM